MRRLQHPIVMFIIAVCCLIGLGVAVLAATGNAGLQRIATRSSLPSNEHGPPGGRFIVTSAGGDRDGRILAALKPVVSAVPPRVTHLTIQSADSTWQGACPGVPDAHGSWAPVIVFAMFYSALPLARIVSHADEVLARLGWHSIPPRLDDGYGENTPLAEWTKAIPPAPAAYVVVLKTSPLPECTTGDWCKANWTLFAQADPPGFGEPGC